MDFPGLTTEQLQAAGGYWTAREIAQQPRIWTQVSESVAAGREPLDRFLRPLLSQRASRVILTGAGTSAFAGECLAPALRRRWRLPVDAVSTTDLVASPDSWLLPDEPTLFVSFARSGNSPESVAALELAERYVPASHHFIVTCNADGALARRARSLPSAHVILMPEEANDRSFAMTSSFSAMLLAAGLAFDAIPAEPATTAALADAGRRVLQQMAPLARRLADERFERIVYLGSKELKGLAREAALKTLELTDGKVVAVADTPLGFRHGPKTFINSRTLVVVFEAADRYTRRYDRDLVDELRADGIAGRVVALTDADAAEHADTLSMPALVPAGDLGLCLPYIVFAQVLAFMQSLAAGNRPDTPNAAGTVSRVVRGVSIYPWNPAP